MTERGRDELSATLLRLRKAAGLSGVVAGRKAGVSQASVSRWESGKYVPTLGDVRALARVYDAGSADRRRMEQLVTDLRQSPNPPARLTMRRAADMQRRIGRIEQASTHLRSFHPLLVPGLLQTDDYARAVFASGGDIDEDQRDLPTEARLDRARILDDETRTLTAVLTAGTLRWPLGSLQTMADQLDHLVEMSRRPNVRIGIITGSALVDVAPVHGFDLFDERAAVVGIETATAFLTDTRDVAAYAKLFGDLENLAVFDTEVRTELERNAKRHRASGSRGDRRPPD